jgi:hypothetical protein
MARWIAGTAFATMFGLCAAGQAEPARHACDAIGEEGWRVVATNEIAAVKDGAPYRAGGDWVVDRVITVLPLCNYFTATGNYSLRSYALDPAEKTERIVLCRGASAEASMPVPPYGGPCPPK